MLKDEMQKIVGAKDQSGIPGVLGQVLAGPVPFTLKYWTTQCWTFFSNMSSNQF